MAALMILSAGIIATTLMTVFMNACAACARRNLYTVKILTQMLATLRVKASSFHIAFFRFVAVFVHYGIGVLFALVYYMMRASGRYAAFNAAAGPWSIGFIYGITGVLGWMIFIRIHPSPPRSVPWLLYLFCIFLGHLVFAFAMIFSMEWFVSG